LLWMCSEPNAQQGNDLLLNSWIIEQTQYRLFESLVLLCCFDVVFSFGSVFHYAILLEDPSAERPIAGLNIIDASRSEKALGQL
jgi:hypothetical protein